MIQPDIGKEKGIWMVFLYQCIVTTSKSYSFLWEKCWKKGRYKNERKRREKEERSENSWGHCEDIIYSREGQVEANQRPRHPSSLGTFNELMAFPSWMGKSVAWIAQSGIEIYLWQILEHVSIWRGSYLWQWQISFPRHWEMVENEKYRVFWFTEYRMYAYWFFFSSKKMFLWYIVAAKLELCSLFCFVLFALIWLIFPKENWLMDSTEDGLLLCQVWHAYELSGP